MRSSLIPCRVSYPQTVNSNKPFLSCSCLLLCTVVRRVNHTSLNLAHLPAPPSCPNTQAAHSQHTPANTLEFHTHSLEHSTSLIVHLASGYDSVPTRNPPLRDHSELCDSFCVSTNLCVCTLQSIPHVGEGGRAFQAKGAISRNPVVGPVMV